MEAVSRSLLAGRPLLLDGGLATRLEEHGLDLGGGLWSARAVLDAPELLRRVHREYLDAGADCITAASYQATIPGLVRAGLDESAAHALLVRSVELAVEAREAAGRDAWVAASVGPFGAYLADGSEYRGRYRIGERELFLFHRARWRTLALSGCDLMAIETIPSAPEVRALLRLLDEPWGSMGAWLSLVCRDATTLADGTDLAELVPSMEHPRLLAIGVNCVAPSLAGRVLATLGGLTDLPLVVYPNSGERYREGAWVGEACDWIPAVPEWITLGARLVGGCCRTGPEEIRRLRGLLDRLR